jgi:DNA-binding transcriptional LysR family regulator
MGYDNHWLSVRQALGLGNIGAHPGLAVDTMLAGLELASSGTGCALANRVYLASYLSTGRLVPALDAEFADDHSYFVVTPERPQRPHREVQVFRDWLVAEAAAG